MAGAEEQKRNIDNSKNVRNIRIWLAGRGAVCEPVFYDFSGNLCKFSTTINEYAEDHINSLSKEKQIDK